MSARSNVGHRRLLRGLVCRRVAAEDDYLPQMAPIDARFAPNPDPWAAARHGMVCAQAISVTSLSNPMSSATSLDMV